MNLDAPTLAMLTTIAGAAIVVVPLSEAIKRVWNPDGPTQDRFMPVVTILLGVGVVLVATFGLGLTERQEIVQAAFNGVFAGLSACGLYDTVRGFTKS